MVRKNVMSNFLKFSSFMSLVRNCLSFLRFIEKSSKQTQEPSSKIRLPLLHQKPCLVLLAVLAIKTHQRPRLPLRYLD